jgi:hypothetical protein
MLDPWIIEKIIRREEDRRREEERTQLEVPVDSPRYPEKDPKAPADETERGVVIIDI